MSPTIKSIALAACLAAFAAQARAAPAPILTFSGLTYISANTGTLLDATSLNSGHYYSNSYTSIVGSVTDFHATTTPAKPGVAGSIDIYKDVTTTKETNSYSYYYDQASYAVTGNASNYAADQWIRITGMVTASEATTLGFSLFASGNYQTTAIPGIGNVNPALPSFFAGFGSDPLSATATGSYTRPEYSNQYGVYSSSTPSISLAAGATSFTAMIYAGGNVSLSEFQLNISGPSYGRTDDYKTTPTTISTLFKSEPIPALAVTPVPEPETYAMFLAGLGLMGAVARRRS
jgi:hypothetical protein